MKIRAILLFLICVCMACGQLPDVHEEPILVLIPHPNPTGDRFNIHVQNTNKSAFVIQVFDPRATLFFDEKVDAGSPTNSFSLDLKDKQKGSYHIVLKKDSFVYTKKFIKI